MNQLKNNGYIHIKDVFKEDANSILLDCLDIFSSLSKNNTDRFSIEKNMKEMFKNDFEALVNCGKACQNILSLYKTAVNKKILSLLNDIGLEKPALSTRPVLFFNHPDLAKKEVYYKTPAHQDWRSIQGSINSVVIWMPLVDIDKKLGAIEIIPGSHINGLCTSRIEDNFGVCDGFNDEDFISIDTNVGDILIFSTFLVHRSGNNISDNVRWSCHFRYNDLNEPTYINRKYPSPYVYYPNNELITPGYPSNDMIKKYYSD